LLMPGLTGLGRWREQSAAAAKEGDRVIVRLFG